MVRNYRSYQQDLANTRDDETPSRITEEDRQGREEREKQAKLALDTFKAMFRSRFTARLLRGNRDDDTVVETLMQWVGPREVGEDGVLREEEIGSLGECAALLIKLTSEQNSSGNGDGEGPIAWPYIKKIRYVEREKAVG